jgi:outer membrane receptor protein involved in Fe transport
LRDELEGAETSASYEITDEGDYSNADLSQSLGTDWGSGGILVSGRYRHRDDLQTQDRPFSREIGIYDRDGLIIRPQLYPEQDEYSAFVVARQALSPSVRASVDAWYGHRDHFQAFSSLTSLLVADTKSQQLSVNGALEAELSEAIRLDFSAGHSLSRDEVDQNNYTHAGGLNYSVNTKDDFNLTYLNLSASGDLMALPGGALSFAVGGEHRREEYETVQLGTSGFTAEASRQINSAYGELLVPLVGENNSGAVLRRVSVSIAGRYDDYSDVGHTWNGKIGLLIGLGRSLTLRGTYSTAFRAPTLSDGANAGVLTVQGITRAFLSPDRPGEMARVIALRGLSELEPETAKIFTVGADLRPASVPGLSLSATFFDYDYKDRLTLPPFIVDAFLQPEVFGALIRPVSSVAEIEQLIADATASGGMVTYQDPSIPLSAYEYIIDLRLANIAAQRVRGVDFDLGYRFSLSDVRLQTQLTGTYLIHDQRQISETSMPVDYVGLFGEPADLRVRGIVSADTGSVGATAAVNYVSGFENTNLLDRPDIDSFTTIDLDLRYRFERGALGGTTTLSLGVRNLLDAGPPFVQRPPGEPDYDPANANPLGRLFLIRLNQTW